MPTTVEIVFEPSPLLLRPINPTDASLSVYRQSLPGITETLNNLSSHYGVCLFESDRGLLVVIRAPLTARGKEHVQEKCPLNIYLMEPSVSYVRRLRREVGRGILDGLQPSVVQRCSIGKEDSLRSIGTLGPILTDGRDLYALTACHVLHAKRIVLGAIQEFGEFLSRDKFKVVHPAPADVLIEKLCYSRELTDVDEILEKKLIMEADAKERRRYWEKKITEMSNLSYRCAHILLLWIYGSSRNSGN